MISKRTGNVLIFFGLFWSALTLLFDGFTVVPTVRQLMSVKYPSTEGTIGLSEVTQDDGSEGGTTYAVRISYVYAINKQVYEGHRYRYQSGSSSDSAWAYDAVAEHRP